MKVYIPENIFNEFSRQIEEHNQRRIIVEVLPPEEEVIYLPNFRDSFTRGVYDGMIKSFMPPKKHPYTNLFSIVTDKNEIHHFRSKLLVDEIGLKEFLAPLLSKLTHHDSVFTLILGRINIIFPIGFFNQLEYLNSGEFLEQLPSESELEQLMPRSRGAFGFLGQIAASMVSPTFFYDGRKMFFIGLKKL